MGSFTGKYHGNSGSSRPLKAALQDLGGQLRRIVPAVCAEKDRRVLQGAEGLAHIQL